MYIIAVKDVDLKLGKTDILKNINVSFEAGKIHGLIGRNGSGKTILICSHSAEDISVLCETVHEMDKGEIQRIS